MGIITPATVPGLQSTIPVELRGRHGLDERCAGRPDLRWELGLPRTLGRQGWANFRALLREELSTHVGPFNSGAGHIGRGWDTEILCQRRALEFAELLFPEFPTVRVEAGLLKSGFRLGQIVRMLGSVWRRTRASVCSCDQRFGMPQPMAEQNASVKRRRPQQLLMPQLPRRQRRTQARWISHVGRGRWG